MRKINFIFCLLAVIFSTFFQTVSVKAEKNLLKIGVISPDSEKTSQNLAGIFYGNRILPSIWLADEEYPVEIIVIKENDSEIESLIDSDVCAILDLSETPLSLTSTEFLNTGGIPILEITDTNYRSFQNNPNAFFIGLSSQLQADCLAAFLRDGYEAENTSVFCGKETSSLSLKNTFSTSFENYGGKIESISNRVKDKRLSQLLTKAKKKHSQSAFLACTPSEIKAESAKSRKKLSKIQFPIVAGISWDCGETLKTFKDSDLNLYVATCYREGEEEDFDNGIHDFFRSAPGYEKENPPVLSAVGALGYDGYRVLTEALCTAGCTDRNKISQAIWDVAYDGICGRIAFHPVTGDAIRNSVSIKMLDSSEGTWIYIGEQSPHME